VVVLVADHVAISADRARMGLEDKSRLQRIEATLGAVGKLVYCARAAESAAAALARQMALDLGRELTPEAARDLSEMLEGNLGLIQREIEKLAVYAVPGEAIAAPALTALVPALRVSSAFELASRIAAAERAPSLAALHRLWAEEGDGGAIGLVFQLSRAFAMALILRQQNVRDRSGLYQTLPEGMRPPSFAADAILGISRRMPEPRLRQAVRLLQAADVELRSSPPSAELVFERMVIALTPA
jgi:DNA polymerase III delta subunit